MGRKEGRKIKQEGKEEEEMIYMKSRK
jgi:hypothetical protein